MNSCPYKLFEKLPISIIKSDALLYIKGDLYNSNRKNPNNPTMLDITYFINLLLVTPIINNIAIIEARERAVAARSPVSMMIAIMNDKVA